ncbi:hypothetical protein FA95DRAFT_1611196 [Auriscalpium vulgare]|uniref:Uncharacterized protein n=1 Tax=Auriscalpium vulgare TaxID=40419 RepID=A0ACB8RAT8_9AGAM|nr:hypothetical protein FA95DRAFT_1611196 [Auriscalpium vulgare]
MSSYNEQNTLDQNTARVLAAARHLLGVEPTVAAAHFDRYVLEVEGFQSHYDSAMDVPKPLRVAMNTVMAACFSNTAVDFRAIVDSDADGRYAGELGADQWWVTTVKSELDSPEPFIGQRQIRRHGDISSRYARSQIPAIRVNAAQHGQGADRTEFGSIGPDETPPVGSARSIVAHGKTNAVCQNRCERCVRDGIKCTRTAHDACLPCQSAYQKCSLTDNPGLSSEERAVGPATSMSLEEISGRLSEILVESMGLAKSGTVKLPYPPASLEIVTSALENLGERLTKLEAERAKTGPNGTAGAAVGISARRRNTTARPASKGGVATVWHA